MSFTTGTLFHQESVKLAELFLEFQDWSLVRTVVLSKNLLQSRTVNTSKRVCREVCSRLRTLSAAQLDLLVHGSTQDQGYLLWLAVCRRYKFIADFAVEIVREKYISLQFVLNYDDFDFFFNKKSEWHEELDQIKPATRTKTRQTLFKMLREADLLTSNNIINAALLSPQLLNVISQENRQDILVFPAFESDLKEWAQ
ncbi:DUF1819 family protein [Leptolyngbya sp. FACHB-541]|uniref:DUF1819 family protein n=1 Tax=Leptolyngbya sp. FACHB-541 TaxID=2692810 RepID=UPI00168813FA|nr:DUF1819 family protein [Leptolyngbya sp. FACHB-541]MBD1998034.1 DUF1819 family protein [Leptolyngbya sp. FACHB-541]